MDMDDSESSGGFTVVAPGSQDDPFTSGNGSGSTPDPASTPPVVTTPASQPAVQTPQSPTISLMDSIPESQRPNTPASADGKGVTSTGMTQEQVDALVTERLRSAQSGWDKLNQGLKTEVQSLQQKLKEKDREVIERERDAKLLGLSPADQQRLKEQWNIDDERAKLDEQRNAVVDYHLTVQGMALYQQYHMFGVTEEELLAIKDIDKMEAFCKDKKLEWFENGGTKPADSTSTAKGNAPKKDEKAPPAGSTAPVDLGGSAPAPESGKLLTTSGIQSMGQNVKSLFSS